MGYNTTLVVLNDALHEIEKDPEFGKKVAQAVRRLCYGERVDISSGNHGNAAKAIEFHHADSIHLIAVGGNCGEDLGLVGTWRDEPIHFLKTLADKFGYTLRRKNIKKS